MSITEWAIKSIHCEKLVLLCVNMSLNFGNKIPLFRSPHFPWKFSSHKISSSSLWGQWIRILFWQSIWRVDRSASCLSHPLRSKSYRPKNKRDTWDTLIILFVKTNHPSSHIPCAWPTYAFNCETPLHKRILFKPQNAPFCVRFANVLPAKDSVYKKRDVGNN